MYIISMHINYLSSICIIKIRSGELVALKLFYIYINKNWLHNLKVINHALVGACDVDFFYLM